MNMFEYALRNKLRFAFKGNLTVEDLWDLSVEELDSIFKTLNAKVKMIQEESLLNRKTKEDEELFVSIDIIKYIVSAKLKEVEDKENEAKKKADKQKILEMLEKKKGEALEGKSIEELQEMLSKLN